MTISQPYVVFGVTGRTGAAVADELLREGLPVRVVVRSIEKGGRWADRGAEVAVADMTDLASMTSVLQQARGAYIVSPQHYGRDDLFELASHIANIAARAATAARVPKLVALSSIGADRDSDTGWIEMNRMLEQRLAEVAMPVTVLRAVYFMENWMSLVAQAMHTCVLPSFLTPAHQRFPMVATRDVGRTAAHLLMQEWTGLRAMTLTGPEEYSPADVALAIQATAAKPIAVNLVPEASWSQALVDSGFSQPAVVGFTELTRGLNSGHIALDSDCAVQRCVGTTPLNEVIAQLVAASDVL